MSVFYTNENGLFTKFTIQLMEERMKAIEQKELSARTSLMLYMEKTE
jgi:hypothetical protein